MAKHTVASVNDRFGELLRSSRALLAFDSFEAVTDDRLAHTAEANIDAVLDELRGSSWNRRLFCLSSNMRGAGASIDPLTLPGRYTSKFDLSITGGKSAQTTGTIRALGYIASMPMISQRVVNETAQTLAEIEARYPAPHRTKRWPESSATLRGRPARRTIGVALAEAPIGDHVGHRETLSIVGALALSPGVDRQSIDRQLCRQIVGVSPRWGGASPLFRNT